MSRWVSRLFWGLTTSRYALILEVQGREAASRQPHTLEIAGSSPAPAKPDDTKDTIIGGSLNSAGPGPSAASPSPFTSTSTSPHFTRGGPSYFGKHEDLLRGAGCGIIGCRISVYHRRLPAPEILVIHQDPRTEEEQQLIMNDWVRMTQRDPYWTIIDWLFSIHQEDPRLYHHWLIGLVEYDAD